MNATVRRWLRHGFDIPDVIIALSILWIVLSCLGCASAGVRTLTAITNAATVAHPELAAERERAGQACFAGHPSADDAERCIAGVHERWALVWSALDVLEQADEAALAGRVSLAQVVATYCALRRAAPETVHVPAVPGVTCEAKP